MARKNPNPIGRTSWDVAYHLLARRSVFGLLAITGWALLVLLGYLWFWGKIGLTSASQADRKNEGSPYVHWWPVVTDLSLQQCEALSREVYELTGAEDVEPLQRTEISVAQVGLKASVASVIISVQTGDRTAVMVVSSGPDNTATIKREGQLRDAVQDKLHSRP